MLFSQIKTASQLKAVVEAAPDGSLYFTRDAMKSAGDTMRNYGVRHLDGGIVELYRRRPVRHGLQTSYYWKASACGTYAVRASNI